MASTMDVGVKEIRQSHVEERSRPCDRYVDDLITEIETVGSRNPRKKVTSLYFGGGSPCLAADDLPRILDTVNRYFEITEGIGIELHPDDVNVETLSKLSYAGITRISIGVQSFNPKFQKILGRKPVDPERLSATLSRFDFETVSMDFIFALPGQQGEDLIKDIDTASACGANHVAAYPFIDFTFTGSRVKAMEKGGRRALLDVFTDHCLERGYTRNSIWTFSMNGKSAYSSMTRENFLGFGCSAATLLRDQFKINTFSLAEYGKRIRTGKLPTSLTSRLSLRQRMVYYLFWTAYGTKIDPAEFRRFFGMPLEREFGMELFLARLLGWLRKEGGVYSLTRKGAFYFHHYEGFYTLSYIDRMWRILRREAFPERITL